MSTIVDIRRLKVKANIFGTRTLGRISADQKTGIMGQAFLKRLTADF
jgi:hypothetical protein